MWKIKKLSELCGIQSGLWKGKKEPFVKALVLRNTNFTSSGQLDYSEVVELDVEAKQLEKREVKKHDIILEKSGGGDKTPVGRVCIHNASADIPYSLSNFTARLRVFDESELDAQFLHRFLHFLYLSGKTEPMQRHSTGIRNLQLAQYKEIVVPLPPLAEQQRIVAKLDAAFAEIDETIKITDDKISNYTNLSSGIMREILNNDLYRWEIKNLSHLSENLDAKRIPITKSKRVVGNVPYYGASGIVDYVEEYIFDDDLLLISEDGANLLMRAYPIAFSVSGKCWVNNHAHVLKFENSKLQKWVELYLNATNLSQYISGMAQPKLNQKKLNEIPIPCPDGEMLERLLNMVVSAKIHVEKTLLVEVKKTNELKKLKSAILAQELQREAV